MTQTSRIHSPSIIVMLYSMGLIINIPGECMGRKQSRIGILIRLIIKSRVSFLLISRTCLCRLSNLWKYYAVMSISAVSAHNPHLWGWCLQRSLYSLYIHTQRKLRRDPLILNRHVPRRHPLFLILLPSPFQSCPIQAKPPCTADLCHPEAWGMTGGGEKCYLLRKVKVR